jgi:hypothetical protein
MRKLLPLGAFTLIFALVFLLGACDDNTYINPDTSFTWPPSAIPLTESIWADGYLANLKAKQWFSFTATADTQYIHFDPGTLEYVYVQLYEDGGATKGNQKILYVHGTIINSCYTLPELTSDVNYYFSVSSYTIGNYKIAVTATETPLPITLPSTNVIPLTKDEWTDDSIAVSGIRWFSLTATEGGTQTIHFEPGTLKDIIVQFYDNTGVAVGGRTELYSANYGWSTSTFRTVTSDQVYYIKVTPYSNYHSGAYKITFTATPLPPGVTPTWLTEDEWKESSLNVGGIQWFAFTATANTHFIHFELSAALKNIFVQLYESTGAAVGGFADVSSSPYYVGRRVTSGKDYYVRVNTISSSGTYRLVFNAIFRPPDSIEVPLAENSWADGNLAKGGEQWFKFTASDSTQYIHFKAVGLTDVNVQLYTRTGTTLGIWTNRIASNFSTFVETTIDTDYYIKVTPYSGNGEGDFKVAFSASGAEPSDP